MVIVFCLGGPGDPRWQRIVDLAMDVMIAHELRQKTQVSALPFTTLDIEKQLADLANDLAIQVE